MRSANNWFPSKSDLDEYYVFYNEESDEVWCHHSNRNYSSDNYICPEKEYVPVAKGDKNYLKILAEIERRAESYNQQVSRKEFIDSLVNDLKLKEAVVTQRFLNGSTDSTSKWSVNIQGDVLLYGYLLLMKRIDADNFLLGKFLSNYSGWSIPIAHKILPTIAASNKTFWKSTMYHKDEWIEDDCPERYVIEHIKNLIAYCYVKWPWARKIDKDTYVYQFEEAIKTLEQARDHFKNNFYLGPMHQIMVDTFGDRKEMVDQINAFRISYEFGK